MIIHLPRAAIALAIGFASLIAAGAAIAGQPPIAPIPAPSLKPSLPDPRMLPPVPRLDLTKPPPAPWAPEPARPALSRN